MKYLENELRTLEPKTNVVVYLTTSTTYCDDDDMPFITRRDCVGNHWAEDYLVAIEYLDAYGVFEVLDVKNCPDRVEITINKEKGDSSAFELEKASNDIPIMKMFDRL